MEPESRLPNEVLARACKSGNEIGWRRDDLPMALEAARHVGLAAVGGQVQFLVPGGTCELYWHSYDARDRSPGEPWIAYVARSHADVFGAFEALPPNAALIADGVANFEFLSDRQAAGVDLEQYLCFLCYFASEDGPHVAA